MTHKIKYKFLYCSGGVHVGTWYGLGCPWPSPLLFLPAARHLLPTGHSPRQAPHPHPVRSHLPEHQCPGHQHDGAAAVGGSAGVGGEAVQTDHLQRHDGCGLLLPDGWCLVWCRHHPVQPHAGEKEREKGTQVREKGTHRWRRRGHTGEGEGDTGEGELETQVREKGSHRWGRIGNTGEGEGVTQVREKGTHRWGRWGHTGEGEGGTQVREKGTLVREKGTHTWALSIPSFPSSLQSAVSLWLSAWI